MPVRDIDDASAQRKDRIQIVVVVLASLLGVTIVRAIRGHWSWEVVAGSVVGASLMYAVIRTVRFFVFISKNPAPPSNAGPK